MVGLFLKFRVEDAGFGCLIKACSDPLTPVCATEAEIDLEVERLKAELDDCADQMKQFSNERPRDAFGR